MIQFLSILGEAALIAAGVALLFLSALILRNPLKPAWLDVEEIAVLASIVIMVVLALAFSAFARGLLDAGLGFAVAIAAGVGVWLAVSVALWLLFGMSARLRACEAGRSPFGLGDAPAEASLPASIEVAQAE